MVKEKAKLIVAITCGGDKEFRRFHTKLAKEGGTTEEEMIARVNEYLQALSEKGVVYVNPIVSCSLWREGGVPRQIRPEAVHLQNEMEMASFLNRLRLYFIQAVADL